MDPHRYTFPSATTDHPPRQQPLPPPPPGQWYPPPPPQFQYQPPPPQHWGPPPPAYSSHGQYPPPHPHLPPYPPPQDWSNTNWGHYQGQEYPANQEGDDWAAKARAWASSKAASENQPPQSQFTPVSRLEGQSPYHDPYQKTADSHYADVQLFNPSSGYHQYPPPGAPPQKSFLIHPQEYTATNSGPTSFLPDEHVAYGAKDGRFGEDSNVVYPHQGSSSASSLVHTQEVPSSYSSIAGSIESGDGTEKVYTSFPLATDSSQVPFHDHLPPPPVGRSILREQQHYSLGNHAAEPPIDLSDQPLNLTRQFSFDHETMMQQNYNNDRGGPVRVVDPVAAISSNHTWTSPHLPGTVYPPFPPVLSSAQQHKPSLSLTSSVPGYSMSGPNFQTSIPSIGIGTASGIHPTTLYPGDVYGVLSGSDRPKKAAVPNWLKEEIIKNKAIIGNSGLERPIDSIDDEAFDKTPGRADQEDSKSIDSPRSAVEDDEEEHTEAAKTAEINQEIKRILTEVLLKVTDELFDDIATHVLEEDITIQVAEDAVALERKPSFAVPAVPIPKASAKVIVVGKAKDVETEDESGKSMSSSPGDLLGLASYASDDDDADDADNSVHHQPITKKTSQDDYAAKNGSALANDRDSDSQEHGNNNNNKLASNGATVHRDVIDEHNFERRKMEKMHDISKPNDSMGEEVIKTESSKDVSKKLSAADDSRGREYRNKQDNKDGDIGEPRKSYVEIDNVKDGDSGKNIKGGKEDESHRRHVERNVRTETSDKNNGLKEKMKDQGGNSGEKAEEYDSKKRSSDPDGKMDRKEKERGKKANDRDYNDRRREHKKDEKEERSRDKHRSESSRHRRQRSPSVGSRVRSSKGNSLAGRAKYSSDEFSDDSKRKLHAKKRNLSRSPSPSRPRKRQDSRSPPSKHSRRRHSPLSSLENTRGRRSRSPARRHK